ncbi:MAG: hypothetical protein GY809_32335 [Planctomycetes bacterium]|nr:hypothetical protein [Planctomycetota bacterium]
MRRTGIMIMWVALLLGQVPLAGSVVICTTEDGRAHIEAADHHDHDHAVDHEGHDHPYCHAGGCVVPAECCQDITLDCISPSLVQGKRVGYDGHAMSLLNRVSLASEAHLDITSISHHRLVTGPDILRSVILLI